ncbi:hypothetical protein ACFL6U_14835 [Planctomycetota bacterium]
MKNVVIGSRGNIRLGRRAHVLADDFNDIWSINSIVTVGGAVYLGTSPNGSVYRYAFGELNQIYPVSGADQRVIVDGNDPGRLTNEHVFVMCTDVAGRLIAAISGSDCRLDRFGVDGVETIFRPENAQYIFSVASDEVGNLYVGTGPEGKIYRLDALGKTAQTVYTCRDKNILSLVVGSDGMLYAGSDGRGLIYRINPRSQDATVLYDSAQPEITALLQLDPAGVSADLYALASSARVVETERQFATRAPLSGRPEPADSEGDESEEMAGGATHLHLPNMQTLAARSDSTRKNLRKPTRPEQLSTLYRIDDRGFVVDVADRQAVFFCMARLGSKILVGTGNQGELLSIDPANEEVSVIYEDPHASQITTVSLDGNDVYAGTANPARLIRLSSDYAEAGEFVSDLVDAKQPANWGKLQLDADLPVGTQVRMVCRSGNVDEVNDPTFSPWTEPVEVAGPVSLDCPLGRYCQFKLLLESGDGLNTPLVRKVILASSIPNLPPVVEALGWVRVASPQNRGTCKITYKTRDANDDRLVYALYFRKIGRSQWIRLVEDHDEEDFEWNTRTVEDGRYELRIVASDAPDNNPDVALTASRISDVLVVDNSGPVVRGHYVEKSGPLSILGLVIRDTFSLIDRLEYTVNSNKNWRAAIPEDLVYDSQEEDFRLVLEDLDPGEHLVSIRVKDSLGNTTYKSFDLGQDI